MEWRMNEQFNYVDLSYLEEISGGDSSFKKELIGIFLTQIPEFVTNMHRFLTKNEIGNLAKEAHTAKSSVLIFMMEKTGTMLKQIQLLAEKNSTDQIPSLINEVETDLANASKELSGYLKNL